MLTYFLAFLTLYTKCGADLFCKGRNSKYFLDLEGQKMSIATTELCQYSVKADIDNI